MKQVTVNVPESKLNFFLQLLDSLGLSSSEKDITIPEEHKKIVRERIKTAKSKDYVEWDKVKGKIKFH